jgi:preprotein translocase subunit SecG
MDGNGVGESKIMDGEPEVETNIPAPIEPPVGSPAEQN